MDLVQHVAIANGLAGSLREQVPNPVERLQVAMVMAACMAVELSQHDFMAAKDLCTHFQGNIMRLFEEGTLSIPHAVHA